MIKKYKFIMNIAVLSFALLLPVAYVNAAPVTIVSPESGITITKGESIVLEADVSSLPDGGRNLVWYSNLNGALGKGGNITISELSSGRHVISLSDTSQSASTRSQQVIINVSP